MISTTIKSFIQADLASVWHSVTSLYDYSWRSDIKDIEIRVGEKQKNLPIEIWVNIPTTSNPFNEQISQT